MTVPARQGGWPVAIVLCGRVALERGASEWGQDMRRKLIVGNWKMNGSRAILDELDEIAAAATIARHVDVAICPPATLIAPAADAPRTLAIGAQDCHAAAAGAFTGCLSAALLWEAGARLTIVGHSERRRDQHETDSEVHAKAHAAMAAGLVAIICVGESEAQRTAGGAVAAVSAQIAASVPADADAATLVVAYEPIWAVGTGHAASCDDVAEMHAVIRNGLFRKLGTDAGKVRILYGGSVTAANAASLLAVDNVDGGLIGGASLKAATFVPIIAAAAAA